jgi:hypothetical protein
MVQRHDLEPDEHEMGDDPNSKTEAGIIRLASILHRRKSLQCDRRRTSTQTEAGEVIQAMLRLANSWEAGDREV